jgi:hypothetical protein
MTEQVTANSGDQTWQRAVSFTKGIGRLPGAFTEAVRMLVHDQSANKGMLRPVTKYQVARLVRGPNFKAMLYFASEALAKESLDAAPAVTVGDLLELYQPADLASMITCLVITRRIRKESPPQLWEQVRPTFARESLVGGFVGVAIPSLGFCPGILCGAMPSLARALMARNDPSTYTRFLTETKGKGAREVLAAEGRIWGCSASQVSSLILTQIGFGKDYSALLHSAITCEQGIANISDDSLRRMRLAHLWLDCFLTGREQPTERLDTKFFPFKTDRDRADRLIRAIDDRSMSWLERNGDELSRETTPKLFAELNQDPKFEIPEELKDVFSLKQITEMEEEDFDKLIDQIDLENTDPDAAGILSGTELAELEAMK